MLRLEQGKKEDAVVTVTTTDDRSASMFYHVLPTMVQSRLPMLPSLRRSLSELHTRSSHSKSTSLPETMRPSTPPPDYTSRPGSGSATPYRCDVADDGTGREGVPTDPIYETSSGINWQYARHGVSMMTEAHRHSTGNVNLDCEATAKLARSLYVQAVAWFLRGLPTNLTPYESLSLEAATPRSVVDARVHLAMVPDSSQRLTPLREPTLLHTFTAILVFYVLALVELVQPWIKMVVAHAYRLEKEHEMTRRVIDVGFVTANDLGRRGVQLVQAVCRVPDGTVGEAMNTAVVTCVQGVAGGVRQGVDERRRWTKQRELVKR